MTALLNDQPASVGQHILLSDLGEGLELDAFEQKQHALREGVQVDELAVTVRVPSNVELHVFENDMENNAVALERIASVLRAAKNDSNTLSAKAAKAVQAAMERYCASLHMPSAEAFASGKTSIAQYAMEAAVAQEESLLDKFFAFLKNWARQVAAWLRSTFTQRGRAKKVLQAAKAAASTNKEPVVLAPGKFQAKYLLPAAFVTNKGLESAIEQAPSAFDDLCAQMSDLVRAAGRMFSEDPSSEAGIWKGSASAVAFAKTIGQSTIYNLPSVGGLAWAVTVNEGNEYPTFSAVTSPVEIAGDREGTISAIQFKKIVDSVERAMNLSETYIKALDAYARKISVLQVLKRQRSEHKVDPGVYLCIVTLSRVLRQSVGLFDRVVNNAANDCARALKFTAV